MVLRCLLALAPIVVQAYTFLPYGDARAPPGPQPAGAVLLPRGTPVPRDCLAQHPQGDGGCLVCIGGMRAGGYDGQEIN